MNTDLVERCDSPELNEILGKRFPVLDDGFVRVVDYMGNQYSIVQAARVSYGKGTRRRSSDEALLRYLFRHRHCYRPDMEVLTANGWLKWSECSGEEPFAVPDPKTKTLKFEFSDLENFSVEDEELVCYENNRMSFAVTEDHRMWFKGKYQDNFNVVRAGDMKKWGHFEPLIGYNYFEPENTEIDLEAQFSAFFLGDGSGSSTNTISFHLKKNRKIIFLKDMISALRLNCGERKSTSCDGAVVIHMKTPDFLRDYVKDPQDKSRNKRFRDGVLDTARCNSSIAAGLFNGLVQSDGSVKSDRSQTEFSSVSETLVKQFEFLAAVNGKDAHRVSSKNGLFRTTVYGNNTRTSLEARASYFSKEHYTGQVFCTTTSTGFLVVRGGPDKFAFICGNSTPFEMCQIKFHVRVPMDCWRQWIRHRTFSVNEYSTRYSKAIDKKQKTDPGSWRLQSAKNKQGSGALLDRNQGAALSADEQAFHTQATEVYQGRLDAGIAREQARKDLPLSTYTEAYWCGNLHNLLHFLGLRMDSHAQEEIRQYANAIGKIVAVWVPIVWESFMVHRMHAVHLSSTAVDLAQFLARGEKTEAFQYACDAGLVSFKEDGKTLKSNRERDEIDLALFRIGLSMNWTGADV